MRARNRNDRHDVELAKLWRSSVAIKDVSDKTLQELVSLKDKVAVITGGAAGLGYSIARRFAEAGATIAIGDLKADDAQKAAQKISDDFGVSATGTALDVAHEESITAMASMVCERFGRLDIWVNNAGIFPLGDGVDLLASTWDQVQNINNRGTFLGTREAARRMMKQDPKGGVVVNIASVRGLRGGRGQSAYTASKHAVLGLTKSLAIELGPHDIRVLAVAPTSVLTPGVERRRSAAAGADLAFIEAKEKRMLESLPLGRIGRPDDIARVALFCASDLSMLMTGSTLLVDAGGMA
jgi:NAD(P)-dependent dehydrogenase (short-subunit alcohol dehydrogenase family)